MMSCIRSKNTKPEWALRRALHARGLRYRLHVAELEGRPDLVFPKFNAIVFVHGCFWHQHIACKYAFKPSTRSDFWARKFSANTLRDQIVRERLLKDGWRVAVVWECVLRRPAHVSATAEELTRWLNAKTAQILEIGKGRAL